MEIKEEKQRKKIARIRALKYFFSNIVTSVLLYKIAARPPAIYNDLSFSIAQLLTVTGNEISGQDVK